MTSTKGRIVTEYAKMWPREVFDIKDGNRLLQSIQELLKNPGVYVLYRDDHPYYIGKTKRPLFKRIWAHANASRDKYYNFWNYFSAFVVPDRKHIDEIEGVLIASMLTANSATPKIERINLPAEVARILREQRRISRGL
jgi:hypothetical protein